MTPFSNHASNSTDEERNAWRRAQALHVRLRAAVLADDAVEIASALAAGADANAQRSGSRTIVLMDAAAAGHLDCVEILLPASEIDARDRLNSTALMHAAHAGRLACVERLLQAGADPLLRDRFGMTALMRAAKADNLPCAQILLPVSDPKAIDHFGHTALMYSADTPNSATAWCLPLLLPVSDVRARSSWAATIHIFAALRNNFGALRALFALGAPIDWLARDSQGLDALAAAALTEALGPEGGPESLETLLCARKNDFLAPSWDANALFEKTLAAGHWACLDILATGADVDPALVALAFMGENRLKMPRWMARQERDEIGAAAFIGEKPAQSNASGVLDSDARFEDPSLPRAPHRL